MTRITMGVLNPILSTTGTDSVFFIFVLLTTPFSIIPHSKFNFHSLIFLLMQGVSRAIHGGGAMEVKEVFRREK